MKKTTLISLVAALALVFAMGLVAGCGGGGNSGDDGPNPAPTPTPSTDPTPSVDPAPTPSTDPEPAADPNEELRETFMQLKGSERAEILVKGTLEASYLGKAAQDYRVLYYVEEEEILNAYENGKSQVALHVMEYFGIDPSLLSNEVMGEFTDMIGELLKFRYIEVGPAASTGEHYDVMVKVHPIDTLGLIGSSALMDAWTAKEAIEKTEGKAAAEDSFAKACIEEMKKVKSRTDTLDGIVVMVPVKAGDNGKMWITDTAPLDEIDKLVIKCEYPDAS